MTVCNYCNREGQLVVQGAMAPQPWIMPPITEWWVNRFYLCRWHRGAWNRTAKKKLRPVDFKPDEVLIAEAKAEREEGG